MRAHSQPIDQRPQVSVKVHLEGLDWFRRLGHWLRSFSRRPPRPEALNLYGTWDATRERFHQTRADAAADIVVARHGISWASKIYGASL